MLLHLSCHDSFGDNFHAFLSHYCVNHLQLFSFSNLKSATHGFDKGILAIYNTLLLEMLENPRKIIRALVEVRLEPARTMVIVDAWPIGGDPRALD